jgi:hypothetical protein
MKDFQVEILVKELKEIQKRITGLDVSIWLFMGLFVGMWIWQ